MIDKKQISILICGKLNESSIKNIHYYSKYKEVVVSCWQDDDLSILNPIKNKENIRIVISKPIHSKVGDLHRINPLLAHFCPSFYYQSFCILKALERANSKYVIKTRSDEYFSNLDRMTSGYFKNGEKYTSSNIFWKKCDWGHFHVGDHVFMSKREDLTASYKRINGFFEKNVSPMMGLCQEEAVNENTDLDLGQIFLPSVPVIVIQCNVESVTACFYLNAIGVKMSDILDKSKSKQILYENFNLVNVNELGEYTVRSNSENKSWFTNFPIVDQEVINSSMDEIFFKNAEYADKIAENMQERGLEYIHDEIKEAQYEK